MKSYYAYYCNTSGKPLMVPLEVKAENKRVAYSKAYDFKQTALKEKAGIKSILIREVDWMDE